jgi:Porin subfamily
LITKCLTLAAACVLAMIGTGEAQPLPEIPPTPMPDRNDQSEPRQAEQAKPPSAMPSTGKPGLSFRIPGTDTVIRPYGSIKLNASADLNAQDNNDALTARSIQLSNSAAQRPSGDTQASARRSRLGFETWTPMNAAFGEFHTLAEMDFAGPDSSRKAQASSDSYLPRLRKAYADFGLPNGGWGALLLGQNDSLFSDTALSPIQWMSDWTFVGMDKVRQVQIRYTYGFGNGISTSVGVEAPSSDVTTTSGVNNPDSNAGGGVGWRTAPDITGRFLYKPAWGFLALRGVLRPQIEINDAGAAGASSFEKSVVGYGVGVTAAVSMLDNRLVLTTSFNAGNGLGRYLDSTAKGFGAVSDFGLPGVTAADATLDTVGVYAGMLGAQYFFTPTLRTNMAIGGARLMSPQYTARFDGCVGTVSTKTTCATVNASEWAGSINLVWSPIKMLDIGVEYQHVERVLRQPAMTGSNMTASSGIENRLQMTAICRF